MAANADNVERIEELLERFIRVLEQQNNDHGLIEAMCVQLGERVVASQQNLQEDLEYVSIITGHVRDMYQSASRRDVQIDALRARALVLLGQANEILNPINTQDGGGNNNQAPGQAAGQNQAQHPPSIIYNAECPTHKVQMPLEVHRSVINNNVEYECPLKLSAATCGRGKKLTATWRNHMKKTCLPKLKECPGPPCPQAVPMAPENEADN